MSLKDIGLSLADVDIAAGYVEARLKWAQWCLNDIAEVAADMERQAGDLVKKAAVDNEKPSLIVEMAEQFAEVARFKQDAERAVVLLQAFATRPSEAEGSVSGRFVRAMEVFHAAQTVYEWVRAPQSKFFANELYKWKDQS